MNQSRKIFVKKARQRRAFLLSPRVAVHEILAHPCFDWSYEGGRPKNFMTSDVKLMPAIDRARF